MKATMLLCVCFLMAFAGMALAQVTIPMNAHYAFHYIDPGDSAIPAVPIVLASVGAGPGDRIMIEPVGDYDNGPGEDVYKPFMAVFSASATLLGPTLVNRVPDALDAGADYVTHTSCPGGYPTDIPTDFTVDATGVTVLVPAGATHLFLAARDCFYSDNTDPDGDYAARITIVSVAGADAPPASLALPAVYPNPFNPRTTIRFELPAAGAARLSVIDVAGRLVRTLVDESLTRGSHEADWDGRDASGRDVGSGVYLARLEFAGKVETARMGLVR